MMEHDPKELRLSARNNGWETQVTVEIKDDPSLDPQQRASLVVPLKRQTTPFQTFIDKERAHLRLANEFGCVSKEVVTNMSRGLGLRWSTMSKEETQLYKDIDMVRKTEKIPSDRRTSNGGGAHKLVVLDPTGFSEDSLIPRDEKQDCFSAF